MTPVFFLSLTAFTLALSASTFADVASAEEQSQTLEETAVAEGEEGSFTVEEKARRTAFVQNSPSEKNSANETLIKPHFAGAKRSQEAEKKSRKIKNQWFFSKTQPKKKKPAVKSEKSSDELPADRPYFKKVGNPILAVAASNASSNSTVRQSASTSKEHDYPRTGFKAPCGHIFMTGEWLYWRTRQEGMEFATSEQIEFDFQSGFRVGLGVHLPSSDGWCIYVDYTNFNPEGSKHADESPYPLFLFQGAGSTGTAVAEAQGRWKLKFQSLDVEFGKAYYLTKALVFSPFFGLKGAWIKQHAHFDYEGGYIPVGQTYHTYFKNDFKGAGPLVGTEMNWQLGAGFSLFGDLSSAFLVGQFENEQKQKQLDGGEVVHLDNDHNLVSPFLQLLAGVAWDYNFNEDRCHFGLSAGFETQYFWGQNQTEQFTADTHPTYVRQKGDLSFYGLTLQARLDF